MMASFSDSLPLFLPFSQRNGNEISTVSIDHNYAKPWSSHPDASNARPLRMLFMEPFPRSNGSETAKDEGEIVNVDGEENPSMPLYDVPRARTSMSDCERHMALLRPEFTEMRDDWEDHIAVIRTTWTVLQNRIFAKVMRILQGDRLARLTVEEIQNEPIQRRLQIDKAAKRVRYAFANVNWDMPLILWLHNLFLEKLRGQLLISYLEVLQTLKEKIPSLIECLLEGTVCKPGGLTKDSLCILLKKTWDPVISSINQQRPKKLPGVPLILVVSNVPAATNPLAANKRHKFWQHQLTCMGKVVNIVPVNNSTSITVANCVENMIASTRSKILEMKGHFPGRVIVLVGFHVGALVATQVALMEQVNAVVCIGYPTLGINGSRGDIEEPVYNTKTPTLFVVGQHAGSCHLDTLEDIREKLRVDTGLIVVGGADDHLRMSRAKKKACGVTQSLVDRCIIDEVMEFLGSTLSQAIVQPESEEIEPVKKPPRKRKLKETAIAVGSQTPDLVKQASSNQVMKALKNLKQDPLLSSTSTNSTGNPASAVTQGFMSDPSQSKQSKRASPKKRPKGTGKAISGKRPLLQLSLQSSKTKGPLPSLSSVKEAAAIASAPELSNLLQSMKPMVPSSFLAPKISSPPSSTVSTLPLAAAIESPPTSVSNQSLSKLLTSPGILKSDEDPLLSQARTPEVGSSMKNLLLAKQLSLSRDSTIDSKQYQHQAQPQQQQSPQQQQQTTQQLQQTSQQQQTQILIHSGSSSQPISIPLSFTLANKVLKSVASTSRPMAASESLPFTTATPSSEGVKFSKLHSTLVSKVTAASSLASSTAGQPSSKSATTLSMKPVQLQESQSPVASVISIGNDTVQMKETPPSITSAPGTVSIDLGQLATSSSILMKFGASSKISLMPTMKQATSTASSSADSERTLPPPSSLSLCISTKDSGARTMPACISVVSKMTPSVLSTNAKPQSIPIITKSISKPGEVSSLKSTGKSLTLLSGSQLKSTLLNPNFITLKLAPPFSSATGISTNSNNINASGNNTIVASNKASPAILVSKPTTTTTFEALVSNSSSQSLLSSSPATSSSKMLLSSIEEHKRDQPQGLVMTCSETKSDAKLLKTSLLVSIPSSNVSTISSLGSGAPPLQVRTSGSSLSSLSSASLRIIDSGVETLGQVTSLLESSPVTVGDQSKTAASASPSQSLDKIDSIAQAEPSCLSSSSSSSSSSSAGPSQNSSGIPRASKSTISSYTAMPKPALPTAATTRTRRIKTPKQYDL